MQCHQLEPFMAIKSFHLIEAVNYMLQENSNQVSVAKTHTHTQTTPEYV